MFLLDAVLPPGVGIINALSSLGYTGVIIGALALVLIIGLIIKKKR